MTQTTPATALFVEVTLARPAACDACARALPRGERAHLVATVHDRRIRCRPCFESGAEPMPDAASVGPAPLALASSAALVRLPTAAWVALAGAAALVTLLASRTARRFVVTLAVALKSAAKLLWSKIRGKKNQAPIVVRQAFEERSEERRVG